MNIKPLPEVVHSSLRSSILLFDLTKVVEELVYNSLDADARKVSVFVGVSTCFVKVVDNGSGITRDGLALLGERYATSKLQNLDNIDATNIRFGFRGESLCSICDVSLLEIVTKPLGRPNGFRKIMKGSKCLYLGIDDRHDVGTTVIVRDFFYNQPVRKKKILFSPKKTLQSIKTCVLRIALMQSLVSFEVVDIESEEELLCIYPSTPLLSLLKTFFGIEVSSSLHKINLSDGILKFSGYVSGPCNELSVEVLQYVYINSRFVQKAPIHKLLNQLASSFNPISPWKYRTNVHNLKRNRLQASPCYILNLCCPLSWYDISVEPLKTSVEFKDWGPVRNLIEKAVTGIWNEKIPHGQSTDFVGDISIGETVPNVSNHIPAECTMLFDEGLLADSKIEKHSSVIQDNHDVGFFPYSMEFVSEDSDCIPLWNDRTIPLKKFRGDAIGLKSQLFSRFSHRSHEYLSRCSSATKLRSDSHVYTSISEMDDYSNMDFATTECSNNWENTLGSQWGTQFEETNINMSSSLIEHRQTCDYNEFGIEVEGVSKIFQTPFLKNLSSQGLPADEKLFSRDFMFDYKSEGFGTNLNCFSPGRNVDTVDTFSSGGKTFNFSFSALWKDEITHIKSSSRMNKLNKCVDTDLMLENPSHSPLLDAHCSLGESHLFSPQIINFDMDMLKNFEPCSADLDMLHGTEILDVDNLMHGNAWFKRMKDRLGQAKNVVDVFSPWSCDILTDNDDLISLDICGTDNTKKIEKSSDTSLPVSHVEDKSKNDDVALRNYAPRERTRRCHSSPPFYRGKKKYFTLNNHWPMKTERSNVIPDVPEMTDLRHRAQPSGAFTFLESNCALDSLFQSGSDKLEMGSTALHLNEVRKEEIITESHKLPDCRLDLHKGFPTFESYPDFVNSGVKWRDGVTQNANEDIAQSIPDHHCNILDISSGILHLGADSLVPDSMNKNFLRDAKVLLQVDKKFIPVVTSGGILAVLDQHAADERIRLEELQRNVLTGKMKTITYLDSEQELVLPEIGYQLIHCYSEQIQKWGWIFNNISHHSNSFKKNMDLLQKQSNIIKLLAVPCILGVNLSDLDLLEFLQQLADTDGSSTMPPSVLRLLKSKACRGAVMFGDALLPSECSLIVEELKRTALYFQCAHGRPTTIPLVNLKALHTHIAKLNGPDESAPNLERAVRRLNASKNRN